jgi:ATP/ADP translocase
MHLLTVAHITPIVSLIAGVLILIMPRFLNFIVGLFLILNGLLGLGLLKWLHL